MKGTVLHIVTWGDDVTSIYLVPFPAKQMKWISDDKLKDNFLQYAIKTFCGYSLDRLMKAILMSTHITEVILMRQVPTFFVANHRKLSLIYHQILVPTFSVSLFSNTTLFRTVQTIKHLVLTVYTLNSWSVIY